MGMAGCVGALARWCADRATVEPHVRLVPCNLKAYKLILAAPVSDVRTRSKWCTKPSFASQARSEQAGPQSARQASASVSLSLCQGRRRAWASRGAVWARAVCTRHGRHEGFEGPSWQRRTHKAPSVASGTAAAVHSLRLTQGVCQQALPRSPLAARAWSL
jgi:hypothetical protein